MKNYESHVAKIFVDAAEINFTKLDNIVKISMLIHETFFYANKPSRVRF